MGELYGIPLAYLFSGLLVLWLLLFLYMASVSARLRKLKKRYRAMMGSSGVTQLEEVLVQLQNKINALSDKSAQQEKLISQLVEKVAHMQGKIGLMRYNAFSPHGSDLSFSIALLNELADGIVITGIHNREDTLIYAKPVEKGRSSYSLTPEERKIIDQTAAARD